MKFTSVGGVFQELDRREAAELGKMMHGSDCRPVRAIQVEKRGGCDVADGAVLVFTRPDETPAAAVCPALLRALRPFVVAAALGIPSGESGGYRVSCPGRKGTTWQVEA